jgi:N-acylneuraminate cytidylyltransferase
MNVVFIPVRGGSKSIPLKNIKPINGKPLVYWTVKAACGCKYVDKVYVATDSDCIREVVEGFKKEGEIRNFNKIVIIGRSAESASDTASTESVMLEFAEKYDFEYIALVQATSPLLKSSDRDKGFKLLVEQGTDSVMSFVRQKRFNWAYDSNGMVKPTNYDVFHRPRRQEFEGYLVENGAFYISSRTDLLRTKNRVSGNIRAIEMDDDSFFEIDEPGDWAVIEALMKKNDCECCEIPEIKMFLTDCDGCLTDGGMYYSESGDEMKKFNTRDGMGFKLLRDKGIITGIITSENVELNKRRAEKLKLDELVADCRNKAKAINELCQKYNISVCNVCYVGDDLNDIEAIKMVGYGCCPADAISEVKDVSRFVTNAKGGEGVIREVCSTIINKV